MFELRVQNYSKTRGFTLIELLVVLVLIALLYSVVTLTTGTQNSRRDLVSEGQRLKALFDEARQEAVLTNQELGWYISEESYGFLVYDYKKNTWSPYDDMVFRERPLQFELEVSELDGVTISEQLDTVYKNQQNADVDQDEEQIPVIVFLSNNETSAFELALFEEGSSDWQVELTGDGYSEFNLRLPYDE